MLGAQSAEMRPQPRAFPLPTADADVRVVALGEHPAVASGEDGELHDEPPAVALRSSLSQRDVALQRDADGLIAAEAERRPTTPFTPSAPISARP